MAEIPNLTEHIAKLRDRQQNAIFGQEPKHLTPNIQNPDPTRKLRSSPFSWFAAGVFFVLISAQIIAALFFWIR